MIESERVREREREKERERERERERQNSIKSWKTTNLSRHLATNFPTHFYPLPYFDLAPRCHSWAGGRPSHCQWAARSGAWWATPLSTCWAVSRAPRHNCSTHSWSSCKMVVTLRANILTQGSKVQGDRKRHRPTRLLFLGFQCPCVEMICDSLLLGYSKDL